ncbi:MAG: GMC family oxidoreductase [Vicinamibacterales bacterium]
MIREITPDHRRQILGAGSKGLEAVERETWDACVIGSGPGGAVTAATLAEAGWRVLLVERGPFRSPDEFNFRVLDMSSRLSHAELTSGARSALLQGNGLGGSSLVFGAVAMKPPHFILDEWRHVSGAAHFDEAVLASHYQHVGNVLSVTRQSPSKETRSNAIVREMATALGCPEGLELVHRYTRGCAGMGLCNLGCGLNLKGTMTNSFLPLALDTGRLTVLTECEAAGFNGSSAAGEFRGSSLATEVRHFETRRLVCRPRIKARVFVLAAGAFFSSALLMRTRGLAWARAGHKIWLQPHAQIFALFDSKVTGRGVWEGDRYLPYNGVPAIYNFTGMMREHRYFWLASTLFPASLATWTSHLPPDEHLALMRRFHYVSSVTITIRDDPERSRVVMREGPQLDFRESRQDREAVRRCFRDAARAFLAVGARRVLLPMLDPPSIEREADLRALDRLDLSYDRLLLYSDHTSGGLSCGSDVTRGATDSEGRLFGTTNIYVADSSVFPSACGVNPSWTIMALSHRMASRLAAGGLRGSATDAYN